MNKKNIFKVLTLLFILFGLISCKKQPKVIEPPQPESRVLSVILQHNDVRLTSGYLIVDLSNESIELKANVIKNDQSTTTVSYSSSDANIATIDANGIVTLNTVGEVIITATADDKQHQIVLMIEDSSSLANPSHTITVEGGTASLTEAQAGRYVLLQADVPEHMTFIRWEFKVDDKIIRDVWMNGNIFKMLDGDVSIKAIYDETLYTLNVVGGLVVGDDNFEIVDGINVYHYPFDTNFSLQALPNPEGKMFVGWDYQTKNNRRGELGDRLLKDLHMPGETLTVWAIYSEKSPLDMPVGPGGVPYSSVSNGYKHILGGTPSGEAEDLDLQGMDGYRFAILSTDLPVQEGDYSHENIMGSNLTNGEKGSYTLRTIFKNHHPTLPVSVEFYATYHGARTTTGVVTIGPNEVVEKTFLAALGFDRPWFGFVIRKATNLAAGDTILLDMVVEKAATFPDGDKQFEVTGQAKWVHVDPYNDVGWGKEKVVFNNMGMSIIATYAQNISASPYGYVFTRINNYPIEKPKSIYYRVINATDRISTYKFQLTTITDQLDQNNVLGYYDLVLDPNGVATFRIDIPEDVDIEDLYFGIVKETRDGEGIYGHNIVIQMAYNNIFQVEE